MELSNAYLILLWGGIALFVLAVIVVVVNLSRHDSITPATVLFAIAIVMIVFPALQSIKIAGIEMEVKQQAQALDKNESDTTAQRLMNDALKKVAEQGIGVVLNEKFSKFVQQEDSRLVKIATQSVQRVAEDSTHAPMPADRRAVETAEQILSQRAAQLTPHQQSLLRHAQVILQRP